MQENGKSRFSGGNFVDCFALKTAGTKTENKYAKKMTQGKLLTIFMFCGMIHIFIFFLSLSATYKKNRMSDYKEYFAPPSGKFHCAYGSRRILRFESNNHSRPLAGRLFSFLTCLSTIYCSSQLQKLVLIANSLYDNSLC